MHKIIGIDFGTKEYTAVFAVDMKDGTILLKSFETIIRKRD
jgi:hypothetical protein